MQEADEVTEVYQYFSTHALPFSFISQSDSVLSTSLWHSSALFCSIQSVVIDVQGPSH